MREGCGSTEPGVCSFVLGTYPQRGSAPPPHLGEEVWENPRVILKCAERPPPVSEIEEYFNSNDVSCFISMGSKAPRVKSSESLHKKCFLGSQREGYVDDNQLEE